MSCIGLAVRIKSHRSGDKAGFAREHLTVVAHALNMLSGGAVAEFRGNGEPLNGFLTRQAELFFAAFEPVQGLAVTRVFLFGRHPQDSHDGGGFPSQAGGGGGHWRRR